VAAWRRAAALVKKTTVARIRFRYKLLPAPSPRGDTRVGVKSGGSGGGVAGTRGAEGVASALFSAVKAVWLAWHVAGLLCCVIAF